MDCWRKEGGERVEVEVGEEVALVAREGRPSVPMAFNWGRISSSSSCDISCSKMARAPSPFIKHSLTLLYKSPSSSM